MLGAVRVAGALRKAHEDFKKTASAEKQIIEQLTNEIDRLEQSR